MREAQREQTVEALIPSREGNREITHACKINTEKKSNVTLRCVSLEQPPGLESYFRVEFLNLLMDKGSIRKVS